MIKAAVIGGAGYTGGEMIRLLLQHPEVELTAVQSRSQSGQAVASVHKDLLGETDLEFQKEVPAAEVLFLCLGHGHSGDFIQQYEPNQETKVIDLSQDHRLQHSENNFIYGLPELNKPHIQQAQRVANPGCFATAIQLALLPLAQHDKLKQPVHVHAITGSTGAGVTPLTTTHFSWRQNNLSTYKAFQHQHLAEIRQSLQSASPSSSLEAIHFIPIRGDFTKGIFCTAYTALPGDLEEFQQIYRDYYRDHPFTWLSSQGISLKEVINTNKCILNLEYHQGNLLVTSIIDNLIKGASGQALQNMNLMFGLDETCGLKLKASGF